MITFTNNLFSNFNYQIPTRNKKLYNKINDEETMRKMTRFLIENNENVNQKYTILYHIEIFDEKNVIEITSNFSHANNTTTQINEINTVIDVNDNKIKHRRRNTDIKTEKNDQVMANTRTKKTTIDFLKPIAKMIGQLNLNIILFMKINITLPALHFFQVVPKLKRNPRRLMIMFKQNEKSPRNKIARSKNISNKPDGNRI